MGSELDIVDVINGMAELTLAHSDRDVCNQLANAREKPPIRGVSTNSRSSVFGVMFARSKGIIMRVPIAQSYVYQQVTVTLLLETDARPPPLAPIR